MISKLINKENGRRANFAQKTVPVCRMNLSIHPYSLNKSILHDKITKITFRRDL